jgi:hypothetical protein
VITVCQRGSASLEAGAVWGGLIGIGVAFRAVGVCGNYSSCGAFAAEILAFDAARRWLAANQRRIAMHSPSDPVGDATPCAAAPLMWPSDSAQARRPRYQSAVRQEPGSFRALFGSTPRVMSESFTPIWTMICGPLFPSETGLTVSVCKSRSFAGRWSPLPAAIPTDDTQASAAFVIPRVSVSRAALRHSLIEVPPQFIEVAALTGVGHRFAPAIHAARDLGDGQPFADSE